MLGALCRMAKAGTDSRMGNIVSPAFGGKDVPVNILLGQLESKSTWRSKTEQFEWPVLQLEPCAATLIADSSDPINERSPVWCLWVPWRLSAPFLAPVICF